MEKKYNNLVKKFKTISSKKWIKEINNTPYFRYYKMVIYKLISFDKFIELLQNDIIIVNICGRVSRSGSEAGRQRNKNLAFKIPKDKIKKLFWVIEIYDANLESNFQII